MNHLDIHVRLDKVRAVKRAFRRWDVPCEFEVLAEDHTFPGTRLCRVWSIASVEMMINYAVLIK